MQTTHKSYNFVSDFAYMTSGVKKRFYMYTRCKDNLCFTQRLKIEKRLRVHTGCVNTICWNDSGSTILSGSDDQHLVITDPFTAKVLLDFRSAHRANIFSAKFLPGTSDRQIVSCSADGMIFHTDVTTATDRLSNGFNCHQGPVYEVSTVSNDSHSFMTCGEDGNVRWFDLRAKHRCNESHCTEDIIINAQKAVMSMAVNPMMPFQLAVGCSDGFVRLYDRRMLGIGSSGRQQTSSSMSDEPRGLVGQFTGPSVGNRCHRITSVVFDEHGTDLLVSYSSDYIYLFSLQANCGKKLTTLQNTEYADEKSTASRNKYLRSSETATSGQQQPQMKRVRLRGDWSDTGPEARPERDRSQPDDSSATSVMQRMSEILTRWLEGTMQQADSSQSEEDHSDQIARVSEPTTSQTRLNDNVAYSDDVTGSGAMADFVEDPINNVVETEFHQTAVSESTLSGDEHSGRMTSSSSSSDAVPGSDAVSKTSTDSVNVLPFEAAAICVGASGSETGLSLGSDEMTTCSVASATFDTPKESVVSSSSGRRKASSPASSTETRSLQKESPFGASRESSVTTVNHQKLLEETGSMEAGENSADDEEITDDIGRRMAAIKLQDIFRKRNARRQTEKRLESRATLLKMFRGHRNSRTMIKKATFWGTRYVMSGSDCGHIFIWDRQTCRVVKLLEGDRHVVNCLQPHPSHSVLASSGIDYDVKIWMPLEEEPTFDQVFTDELMQRNEIMLEETRDTVSVPATFMLRMLASMSRVRRERMRQPQQQPE